MFPSEGVQELPQILALSHDQSVGEEMSARQSLNGVASADSFQDQIEAGSGVALPLAFVFAKIDFETDDLAPLVALSWGSGRMHLVSGSAQASCQS